MHLMIFYFLFCIYFSRSSCQIRYGFPIFKKASSVLQYNEDALALLGAQIFAALPYILEIRCLIDFTLSKTSLDIFQFWQLFQYHIELYCAKNGNYSYIIKPLGEPTRPLDKCIFGALITAIFLGFLFGPIMFFSEFGAFIQTNPVKDASIAIEFVINKQLTSYDLQHRSVLKSEHGQEGAPERPAPVDADTTEYFSRVPYTIFRVNHPNIYNFTERHFKTTSYRNWTELKFFKAD